MTDPEEPILDVADLLAAIEGLQSRLARVETPWATAFLAWAEGHVETLDFDGAEVPQRVRDLLADAFMTRVR